MCFRTIEKSLLEILFLLKDDEMLNSRVSLHSLGKENFLKQLKRELFREKTYDIGIESTIDCHIE